MHAHLTAEQRTGSNPTQHSFGYDLAGNRTAQDGVPVTFDAANKLYSIANGAPPNSQFSHDGDGTVTMISPYAQVAPAGTFAWDGFNHLTSVNSFSSSGQASYGYDGSGHRVWMQPGQQSPYLGKTFYVFDGDLLLGEVQMQGQQSQSGFTFVPVVTAAYTWGAEGLVSERISNGGSADLSTGRSLWYSFGPQGETRQHTDSTATLVDSYTYTNYGVPVATTGTDANPFRYGGQVGYYTDSTNGSGIVLCGHRWYDPALARWLSRDPSGYLGGINLYDYCGANPVGGLILSGCARCSNGCRISGRTQPSLVWRVSPRAY